MRTVIVGAGPTGLYTAIALARRGHDVVVVDRDRGPDGGQRWDRRGVMQFHHPHFFRRQVADALLAEMPGVWHGLLAAGAQPATVPELPGMLAGLIVAAAQADPEMLTVAGPYLAMLTLPGSLGAVQARAREIYASGWRPPIPPGPSREELAGLVTAAVSPHSQTDAVPARHAPGHGARTAGSQRAA